MTNYPRDEFDQVPENSARHGVHRASLEVAARSLVPLMIFGVAALCIGLLAFMIVPKISHHNTVVNSRASQSASQSATTLAATPTPKPATSAPATVAPTTAAVTPSTAPAATVDKTTPVAIFNATGISGLAGQYSGRVSTDGWTVSQTGNWNGSPQQVSSIIYSGPEQKANAEELSKLLNIPTILDSTEMGVPLTIVLGPGA